LTNYGVEHPMQSEIVQEKVQLTMMKNHGVEHSSQSEEVKAKHRQTCLKNHGVEFPSQSSSVQEKFRKTNLARRGVECPGRCPIVKAKKLTTRINNQEFKYSNQIANNDFSEFQYLWDTVECVFLIGIEKSLNRIDKNRYVGIKSNKNYKIYIDILTNKKYQIDKNKFSIELPYNFVMSCFSFNEQI
jgi:hypothetical protein